MLILTLTIFSAIITAIGARIDWIMIVAGAFADGESKLLKRWT